MAWSKTRTKEQSIFIEIAHKNIGNMTEALEVLDSGDPYELIKLAGKWGISIDEKKSISWIEAFTKNQGEKLPDSGDTKIPC